jgi:ADP-ribosylation factor 2-binding protein
MLGQYHHGAPRGLEKEFKSMSFDERDESTAREGKQVGGVFDMGESDEDMCDIVGTGGSQEDNEFDEIVGALEMIIIDPAFNSLQNSFCRQHCCAFEATEENKLCYTDIFDRYTDLLEGYIEQRLKSVIAGFRLDKFATACTKRKDDITGDVFELLLSLGDFNEFKQLMLSHKAALDGSVFGAFCVSGFKA